MANIEKLLKDWRFWIGIIIFPLFLAAIMRPEIFALAVIFFGAMIFSKTWAIGVGISIVGGLIGCAHWEYRVRLERRAIIWRTIGLMMAIFALYVMGCITLGMIGAHTIPLG